MEHDLDLAFAALIRLRVGGLIVGNDAFFNSRSELLAALSTDPIRSDIRAQGFHE